MDDVWKAVKIEPETIAANGNESDIFGPTIGLVSANGHAINENGNAPAPVKGHNRNGRHDEAEEPSAAGGWATLCSPSSSKRYGG